MRQSLQCATSSAGKGDESIPSNGGQRAELQRHDRLRQAT